METQTSLQQQLADVEAKERLSNWAALAIAVLSLLLAVTTMGAEAVGEELTHGRVELSNLWAFYQAKNIRQHAYRIGLDELELQLASGTLSPEARVLAEKKMAEYKATIASYDSEPETGEGKKELSERARALEKELKVMEQKASSYDFSLALFQIAITLGSVTIIADSRQMLWATVGLGVMATLLLANGFFSLVPL